MEKKWVDPTQIYVHGVLNNRELDKDYIGELSQSMKDKGFLPEFPIDVFLSENLANIDTELPFVCACGAHRTFGAINAKLDRVLVHIHDGREEDFIERMHLDNFKFDPAQHSGIGQPFTQKEKRAAVTQLLLLPKFFEQTNTALQEAWRIPESNIRRWRKEVIELLETNSPELRSWGISDGRLTRLRALVEKPERVDQDGKVVKIRKPRLDASDDEKEEFFEQIREDLYILREASDIDFEWNAVKQYCGQKWKIDVGWRMYEDMHIDQLRKLHQMLLEQDADFIEKCTAIHAAAEAFSKSKEDLEKACKKTERVFSKLVGASNTWDEKFKSKWSVFEGMVKAQLNIEVFDNSRWAYTDYETAEELQVFIEHHKAVHKAVENGADWIAEFVKKEQAATAKQRKKVSKAWTEKRDAAIAAINDYGRDVSFDRIVSEAEKKLYKSHGYFAKIFDAESVSTQKNIGTLEDEVKSLDRLINAVKNDVDWVTKIPAAKKAIEVIAEANGVQLGSPDPEVAEALFFVKMTWKEGDRHETLIFESNPFQGARDISDLPDSLRQQLVECARKEQS